MKYNYIAYTIDKKIIKDSIVATSESEVIDIIDSFGHKLLKLEKVKSFQPDWSQYFPSLFKVKPDEIIVFSRQLKLLIEAGNDIVSLWIYYRTRYQTLHLRKP
jgi:type II secretory pathway component PulF